MIGWLTWLLVGPVISSRSVPLPARNGSQSTIDCWQSKPKQGLNWLRCLRLLRRDLVEKRMFMRPSPHCVSVILTLLITGTAVRANDWPQFLGPSRDGTCPETDLAATFPSGGPKVLWQKDVGQGFSGP